MQGIIEFIRSIRDAFSTAFGKGTKKRRRPTRLPQCGCGETLLPEEVRQGACDDCWMRQRLSN